MTIALITGANRGLGRSAALHLADRGVDIIFTYRGNDGEARAVIAEIEAKGRRAAALQLDVSDSSAFEAFAAKVKSVLTGWDAERFDYLLNNAGHGLYAAFAETSEADFDAIFAVHVKGPFFLTQKLLPLIADGGRILNVSSGLTRITYPGSSAYAAAKSAMETLTRYQARELGDRRIRVNIIAPGAIETDFGGGRVRDNADINQMVAANTALGRVGLPDDIGAAVAAILSDDLGWMNAQRIEVSGGQML